MGLGIALNAADESSISVLFYSLFKSLERDRRYIYLFRFYAFTISIALKTGLLLSDISLQGGAAKSGHS
jgi:hypothetical protein